MVSVYDGGTSKVDLAVKRLVHLSIDTSLENPSDSDLGNVTKGIDGVHCCVGPSVPFQGQAPEQPEEQG